MRVGRAAGPARDSGTLMARAPATWASSGYISNERQAKARLVSGSLKAWASCWQSMTAPQPVAICAGVDAVPVGERRG